MQNIIKNNKTRYYKMKSGTIVNTINKEMIENGGVDNAVHSDGGSFFMRNVQESHLLDLGRKNCQVMRK